MEKNAYAMAKFGLESKDSLISKKGCGFYMKYIFLFTSVIQFLIILGLVLFMIYGNAHAGTDTHLRHLEEQVQELYGKVVVLSAKNQNLTRQLNATGKEKLGCFQFVVATQKALEKCNASLRDSNANQMMFQNIVYYAQYYKAMAEDCQRNMNILNVTCYAEKLGLREEQDRLAREAQRQRENCSKATEKLQEASSRAAGDWERCQAQVIDLRTERSGLAQGQEACRSLGEKVLGKLQAAWPAIQMSMEQALPSHQVELVTGQLEALGKKLQEDMQSQAQQNGQLYTAKLRCEDSLRECGRQRDGESQRLQQKLQGQQAACDAEAKRSYQERQALKEEAERLSRQVQEKSQLLGQAEVVRAQLESCRKAKTEPPWRNSDRECWRKPSCPTSSPQNPWHSPAASRRARHRGAAAGS
ncbi:plasmalemma vesicle-associated protein isoform X1 [Emydura macquarii macquarii]|uniref:plasmalemma vesicle-associated protein isoform X1 n=1 Tax=Emydura macquarii macquarii TaxID=1129001 RepID=UPI00352AE916